MKKLHWLWLLVPFLGLAELGGHVVTTHRAPNDAAWEAVAERVRELRQADELVVVAPHWAEPHARRVLGDAAMPLRDVSRPDASGYARAIEISLFGKRELPEWTTHTEERFGKFTLRVLDNPDPKPVLFDFTEQLGPERAQVFTEARGKQKPCAFNKKAKVRNGALHGHPTFPRQRFECGGGDWHFVGATVIEDEQYRPRRCLWAHPGRNTTTVIQFKDVTLGRVLRGYGGISYFLDREGGRPVDLEVVIDGQSIGQHKHRPKRGFQPFEFSTEALQGQTHDVEFRVSAKNNHKREFCFQADIR